MKFFLWISLFLSLQSYVYGYIDDDLIKTIIHLESRGKPFVIGDKGKKTESYGLMQLVPVTASYIWKYYRNENKFLNILSLISKYKIITKYLLFIPDLNVYTGKLYLKWLYKYCGSFDCVIACYASGISRKNKDNSDHIYVKAVKNKLGFEKYDNLSDYFHIIKKYKKM